MPNNKPLSWSEIDKLTHSGAGQIVFLGTDSFSRLTRKIGAYRKQIRQMNAKLAYWKQRSQLLEARLNGAVLGPRNPVNPARPPEEKAA